MNFEYPQKTIDLIEKVDQFMKKHLFSHEKKVYEFSKTNLWENYPELDNWKKLAKKEGLWNLFLPSNYGDLSPGLTNLEYAPLAEKMGSLGWASEVFNCSHQTQGIWKRLQNMVLINKKKNGLNQL